MLACSRNARRLPALVARSLSTESATPSGTQPPPLPLPGKHPTTPKPAARSRLNPAPRPATTHGSRSQVLSHLPPSFGQNQILPVADSTRALLESVVAQFDAPIRYAFAYGSGVFAQDGYASSNPASADGPMLDFMFAVTHPAHWHSINMGQFPGHYPLGARILGSSFVARVEDISPGVWFNSMVKMDGVTIKYGITTVDTLCADLLNWRSLYLAGRMHKPIRIIKDDARVRLTQQVNLTSALRTALLTLPSSFPERALFARIAALSYAGDVRMLLPAENRAKVANIVHAQGPQFRELYHRLAVALPGVHWPAHGDTIEQDTSAQARAAHLRKLPSELRARVVRAYTDAGAVKEADEAVYWARIAGDAGLPGVLDREIVRIVRGPSAVQTLKGVVSAGPTKSMRYAAEKVGKWWKGAAASRSESGPDAGSKP